MKKILIAFIFIWLVYLVYLNFFYKGTKILCAMGLLAATAITIAFFAGIFWVGLPISYLIKWLFYKLFKPTASKNQILMVFSSVIKPLLFIFFFPLLFGTLILFKVFPSFTNIGFSNKFFFAFQFLGLLYIYFSLSGKFNKCLLK